MTKLTMITMLLHYHLARMRYVSTDSPLPFTGTSNCAAQAEVFVYL